MAGGLNNRIVRSRATVGTGGESMVTLLSVVVVPVATPAIGAIRKSVPVVYSGRKTRELSMLAADDPVAPCPPGSPCRPAGPGGPSGPSGPGAPAGAWPGAKSASTREPSATFGDVTALFARSTLFTWPSAICLDLTWFLDSSVAA